MEGELIYSSVSLFSVMELPEVDPSDPFDRQRWMEDFRHETISAQVPPYFPLPLCFSYIFIASALLFWALAALAVP